MPPPILQQACLPDRQAQDPKKIDPLSLRVLMQLFTVFGGFLAAYQLRHKIEKVCAKELAKRFYDALKNDSASIAGKFQNRIGIENPQQY